jgi:integrase
MPRFILLGLYTGRRKEAILSLRWSSVNFKTGEISFEIPGRQVTKKKRGVMVIPKRLLPHLRRWKAQDGREMGYVVNRQGAPIGNIKKGFAGACRRAGLDDVTPHSLKHTAISWRLQAGVSVYAVSKAFATSVKTIEAVYGHLSHEAMQAAADMVRSGALNGAPNGKIRVVG